MVKKSKQKDINNKLIEGLNTIIPIKIADKEKNNWRELWIDKVNPKTEKTDILNLPKSFRMLVGGGVDAGKTTFILNLLVHIKPLFEEIYVLHGCDITEEYDIIEPTDMWYDLDDTELSFFNNPDKIPRLLIVDDYAVKNKNIKNKDGDLYKLNRICNYYSSHDNLSVIFSIQNIIEIYNGIRRTMTYYVIFKTPDLDFYKLVCRKYFNLEKEKAMRIYNKYLKCSHDSLMVDMSRGTKWKYRINGMFVITEKKN